MPTKSTLNEQVRVDTTCLELLKFYKDYWLSDSAGLNGFRELFGREFLQKCDWTGKKWSAVNKYLGPENRKLTQNGAQVFLYKLNLAEQWFIPGSMFLEIRVIDDVITFYNVRTVDG